jgi:hypothetical protein
MSRQFLTGLNLNKNELLNARIQNLANAPSSPVAGQIYYNTGDNTLRYWNGTAWLTLAQGGSVTDAINNAINALDTDDIEEGSSNLYYTTARAKTDAAALLTGASLTNITITGDGDGLTITAENGVADSDTDDLTEGSTNLYFTDSRAVTAVETAATSADTANKIVKRDGFGNFAANEVTFNAVNVGDAGYVSDEGTTLAIEATTGNALSLGGATGVTIGSTGGDITLSPDGNVHVNASVIATGNVEGSQATFGGATPNADGGLYVRKSDDSLVLSVDATAAIVDINGTLKVGPSYTSIEISDDGSGNGVVYAPNNNLLLQSDNGNAGVYLGTAVSDNRVVAQGAEQTLTNKTLGTGTVLGADLDANSNKIINVATPTANTDAANKAYVDSTAQGLDVKASVHAATTTAGTLATSFENGDTVDGHTLSTGDRILIKNQADPKENGIYVVNASGAPTRAADADTDGELTKGSFVFVENGSQASTGWVLSTLTGALDATGSSRLFTQFSGAGLITAGNGLTKTGNTLDVVGTADRITVGADSVDIASTYEGQTSIVTVGTITTGTWNGTTIAIENGGTGATTAAGARANLGAVTKYAVNNPALTATSGSVSWVVTHNLGTEDVIVQLKDISSKELVEVDVDITTNNTVTLSWVSGNVVDDSYRVVVIG